VISAATAGQIIWIQPGTFVVGATINGKSGISIFGSGKGTVFDMATLPTSNSAIYLFGTAAAGVNLTANAAKGDVALTVGDSSTFTNGTLINVKSSAAWRSSAEGGMTQGEIHYCKTPANGTTVSLQDYDYLLDSYAMVNTATIAKLTPMANVEICDIYFAGAGSTASHDQQIGIQVYYGVNLNIHDCYFNAVETTAILLVSTINSSFQNNYFAYSNKAGTGYGIAVGDACQNLIIQGNFGLECRHMISIGGGAGGGQPRNINIIGNRAHGNTLSEAFSSHNCGENINYIGNVAMGCKYGFGLSNYSGIVSDNETIGCDIGISIDSPQGDGLLIKGNRINFSTEYGIYSNTDNARRDMIINNYIQFSTYHGIFLYNKDYCEISGNIIQDCGGIGIYLITCTYNAIRGNNMIRCGTLTDGTYHGIYLNGNCVGNVIDSNWISVGGGANQINDSIQFGNATDTGNFVKNNHVEAGRSYTIRDNGTPANKITQNMGYVTENSGTSSIASGTTSIVVAHGCAYTPLISEITVTPSAKSTADPTFYLWVDTIGATNFTVNCTVNPGAANLPFGWSVRRI
jgi:parallel beta-helix repeat protein